MPSGDRPSLLEKLTSVEADDLTGDAGTPARRSADFRLVNLTPAERDGLEAKARTWLSDVLKSAKGPPRRTEAEREKPRLRRGIQPGDSKSTLLQNGI